MLMPNSHGAMSDQYQFSIDEVAWSDWLQADELEPFW
jgi:hypothetical protein